MVVVCLLTDIPIVYFTFSLSRQVANLETSPRYTTLGKTKSTKILTKQNNSQYGQHPKVLDKLRKDNDTFGIR